MTDSSVSPPIGSLDFGDLRRLEPVSRSWGFDRGSPVDRYYIERFLAARAVAIHGRVLEIAEPLYTRMFGGDRVSRGEVLDVHGGPEATYTCPLEAGDELESSAFDCIVCTQTLQFIYDFRGALETLHRILKPGGTLLLTVPGITVVGPGEPEGWYWSFTVDSLRRLLLELFAPEKVDVEAFGNVLAATAFLYGCAASELTNDELDAVDPGYQVIVTAAARR